METTVISKSFALLPLIVILPALGALVVGLWGRKLGDQMSGVLANLAVWGSFGVAVMSVWALYNEPDPETALQFLAWKFLDNGFLKLDIAFQLDRLSAVMVLVVTGVSSLIHLYSLGYMHGDRSYSRYFSHLNMFVFFMLLLVLGKNLLVLFAGWEGVGLSSYLLIGFWYEDMNKAKAGKKAFIVNRIGDLGFMLAMLILLMYNHGDLDFQSLEAWASSGATPVQNSANMTLICLLLFVGAMGKSAQIPLYVWLPDAMAGPTPVSALIHAATMVTAGVYMVARLSFLFVHAPMAMAIVAGVGAATALFAATIGIVQRDIKKVLAYSTVSQLGYMFLAVGSGAFGAGVFHVTTHAFFKACLFLGAGSVIHGMSGEQDIFKMGGLFKKMPITAVTFLVSTLAIAGLPPLSGFFSKDEILTAAWLGHTAYPELYKVFFAAGLLGALMTAFYMMRLFALTFLGPSRVDEHTAHHVHESPWTMTLPLVVLALLAIVAGFMGVPGENHLLEHWFAPVLAMYTTPLEHSSPAIHWALIGASVAVGVVGLLGGYFLYRKGPEAAAPIAKALGPVYRFVLDKYRVDEFYGWVFVKPMKWISVGLHKVVDAFLIDKMLVNGSAWVVRGMGLAHGVLARGEVHRALLGLLLGLVALWLVL